MVSALSVPSKDRRALLIPVTPGSLWPGLETYERVAGFFRDPRVDLYGVLMPFGIIGEAMLMQHPEILVAGGSVMDRRAQRVAALRLRAWLDDRGAEYTKVVFIVYGSMVPIWSAALRGTKGSAPLPVADRVELVRVNRRTGFRGTLLQRELKRHLSFGGSRDRVSS